MLSVGNGWVRKGVPRVTLEDGESRKAWRWEIVEKEM